MSAQPSGATVPQVPTDAGTAAGPRPKRADARRNRERLVLAARQAFEDGGDTSMEGIARSAGVGIGTLYRHFPRRIDVVEAVYQVDVDELVAAAEDAAATLEPWPAMVAWLEAFVRYARGKRVLLEELHEAFDKNPQLRVASRERVVEALALVLGRAQQAGVVRTDVDGSDVMQLVGSMCTSATLAAGQDERLLRTILDGLRSQG